jgi:hypothetical protein
LPVGTLFLFSIDAYVAVNSLHPEERQLNYGTREERHMSSPQILEVGTLIVGSGMAGGALGLELCERGRDDWTIVSTGSFGTASDDAARSEGWVSTNGNYRPVPGIAGKIGGRAAAWQGVVLPIHTSVLTFWPEALRQLLPAAVSQVERYLRDWKGRPLDEPTCLADAILAERALAEEGGFRTVPLAARPGVVGGDKRLVAYNPAYRLMSQHGEILPRGGEGEAGCQMKVLDNCKVLWIESCAGPRFVVHARRPEGSVLQIRAQEVVLAAGTLENTRIYAQSLHRLAGECRLLWPGLVTKIKHGIITRPGRWMQAAFGPSDSAILVSEHPELYANLFLEVRLDSGRLPYLDLWWLAEQRSTEAGVIEFRTGTDVWRGAIDGSIGPTDRALIERREEFAVDLLRQWGCPVPKWGEPVRTSQASAKATVALGPARYVNALGLSDHESGTLGVGRDVDWLGRSWAMPGISVAGPATFARAGAANPSLTILALARIAAVWGAAHSKMEAYGNQRPVDGYTAEHAEDRRDGAPGCGGPAAEGYAEMMPKG